MAIINTQQIVRFHKRVNIAVFSFGLLCLTPLHQNTTPAVGRGIKEKAKIIMSIARILRASKKAKVRVKHESVREILAMQDHTRTKRFLSRVMAQHTACP
jgi:hypothetical protein